MRVLQVTIYGEPKYGGPPQKIFALSRELANRGHEVQVLTFHSKLPQGGHGETSRNFTVHYLSWIGRSLWQFPRNLRALRAAVRWADIVHCYGLYNLLCPIVARQALNLKRPYVLEPLGMYVPRARNVRAKVIYHKFFTSWMARCANRVIATSPREAAEFTELVPEKQIVLRANGVDVAAFQSLPDAADFRASLGIKQHERILLYIGRISPIKNLEQLVQAFVSSGVENVKLLMIGPMLEPEYAAKIKKLIIDLGLHDRVLLLGPRFDNEKLVALAAADLFVLPSQYESFGNAAAEAVAAGLPVLLTDGCGIAPLIHERAGLAVPATVPALAEGLRIMLNDPGQREALTRQRASVLEELSWKEPLRLTEQLYEEIVGGKHHK